MKGSRIAGKLLGSVLVCLMVGTVLGTLLGITNTGLANNVSEDPFDYQGKYVIDASKLTPAEKQALPYVQKYAYSYRISPALIMAIIKQESSFDPNAVGDGGLAIGYMQLHWDAAYDAGYRSGRGDSTDFAREDWPTDGLNPDTNTKFGCGYLKICYNKHKDSPVYGDPIKNAISAYNLGWPHGPDKSNENSYVNPIVTNYEYYKSKYISSTPTPVQGTFGQITPDSYLDIVYYYGTPVDQRSSISQTLSGDISGPATGTVTVIADTMYFIFEGIFTDTAQGLTFSGVGLGEVSNVQCTWPDPYHGSCTQDIEGEFAATSTDHLLSVNAVSSGSYSIEVWVDYYFDNPQPPGSGYVTLHFTGFAGTGTYSGYKYATVGSPESQPVTVGDHTYTFSAAGGTTVKMNTFTEGKLIVAEYASNPGGTPPRPALGKFVEVTADIPPPAISSVELRVYYTDEEIANSGVDESRLVMYTWDGFGWVKCQASGVNTAANYVWARLTGFSIYAPMEGAAGCFIATAAYGTSTAEQLDTLRAFRDEVLLLNSLGSQLVAFYYEVSPPLADFISHHDLLRTVIRELLVDPTVSLATLTQGIWGK